MSAIFRKPILDMLQTLLVLLSQSKCVFNFKLIATLAHNINGLKRLIILNRRNKTDVAIREELHYIIRKILKNNIRLTV
jgi:hypothetical protein